jgi:hypothetical protein
MRNLARLTNAANRIEAWRDWQRMVEQAEAAGHADLIKRYQPLQDAGWRMIDKAIAHVRDGLKTQPKGG